MLYCICRGHPCALFAFQNCISAYISFTIDLTGVPFLRKGTEFFFQNAVALIIKVYSKIPYDLQSKAITYIFMNYRMKKNVDGVFQKLVIKV